MLFALQLWHPLRVTVAQPLPHAFTNLIVAITAAVPVRLLVIPAGLAASAWARQHGFGILNWIAGPVWLRGLIAFLLLDFTFYYWHRLNHRIPFLWRFHNVHHIDVDLDVSTALRFHFGEIALSTLFRILQIVLIGPSAATFLALKLALKPRHNFTTATGDCRSAGSGC